MSSQQTPDLPRRASSAKSLANSHKINQAILGSAIAEGIDELTHNKVAKLAGLSTGSVYSRFEDSDELAIGLWQATVCDHFRDRLTRSVDYFNRQVSLRDKPKLIESIENDYQVPDEIAKLGAEFLIIARRNPVVGEVVIPQVTQWINEFGLSSSNNQIDNAAILLGLSSTIGTALRSFVTLTNPNWGLIGRGLRNAVKTATPIIAPTETIEIEPILIASENPIRTALLISVIETIGKSGFAHSTVSRIVRRAGVTNGSLYNLYLNKEELTDDAMAMLLKSSWIINHHRNSYSNQAHRQDFGLTHSFDLGLTTNRRKWLDFRLECLIASRNHAPTLKHYQQSFIDSAVDLAKSMPDFPLEVAELISSSEEAIGLGFISLDIFTPHLAQCDIYSVMCNLAIQNQLAR